jgi:hypothetical protein
MRLFLIKQTGDPFNKYGWDVHEYTNSFDEPICVFRGDLSPVRGRDNTIRLLRRLYKGCKIRVEQ